MAICLFGYELHLLLFWRQRKYAAYRYADFACRVQCQHNQQDSCKKNSSSAADENMPCIFFSLMMVFLIFLLLKSLQITKETTTDATPHMF
jgi:hypothetical protein